MTTIDGSRIKKVVVACDAGMGSSVLLTSQLAKSLGKYSIAVEHSAVNHIPADADLVLCQNSLVPRARATVPDTVVLGFQMFLGDPLFASVEKAIKEGATLGD